MIPKRNKFHRRYFEMARRKMRLFRFKQFTFLFRSTSQKSRFAVVISKKVARKAVDRNKYRRVMYELFENHFLQAGITIQVICLYKGSQIPENRQAMTQAIEAFKDFYTKKQTS